MSTNKEINNQESAHNANGLCLLQFESLWLALELL